MSTRNPARGAFANQLTRAMAQRGKLDVTYQTLSDHWTGLLQRLYPVWALVGPGLADPAHIEIHSRTVYLDSDQLLGSAQEIQAGRLERRAILVCFGAAIHEVLHAKHTKRWVLEHELALSESQDEATRQLAKDIDLVEEPRMEACGVREFAPASARGRFVRAALAAAVTDVIVSMFVKQIAQAALAGAPISRDMCGRAMTYLRARTHYGILDPAALAALEPIWRSVLGAEDVKALDDLYAKLIWIPDGEIEPLERAAKRYREIIGAPDPPPPGAGAFDDAQTPASAGEQAGGQPGGKGQDHTCASDGPGGGARTLAEALEEALSHARQAQVRQYEHDVVLQDVLDQAQAKPANRQPRRGAGTGAPGGRMPDRGVNRPPHPDERAAAMRFANELRKAQQLGTKQIDKRTPGGRFNSRSYTRGQAQAQRGAPVTSHAWQATRVVRAPIEEPHVGLIVDTSGSMCGYEYALGPVAWITQTGLHLAGGRLAIGLFGNAAELLHDGARPMSLVPGIRTGGGTAFAGDAIEMVCEPLDMTNPRRPRFLYILSDGGWYDTKAGVAKIHWLAEQGVPAIHISIGQPPLSVEAARVVVITDPASAMDVIARDTVHALRAGTRRRA